MKKIMLIVAGAFCLSAAAVQAQDQQPAKDSISITPPQPPVDASTPSYRRDMMKVEATAVPEAVKSTLARPQFKGWENGAVYTNKDNSVYVVEINDAVENRVKAFRFDATGKPIQDN